MMVFNYLIKEKSDERHLENLTLIAARQMCHSPPECSGGRVHFVDISISFDDAPT